MSRPDDITGLLQKGGDPTAFRQGRLLTFNPVTGANTVLVQGATLTNLPLLIAGGVFNLQGDDSLGTGNGNVVVLMRMKSSWAILGRVLTQGDPNIISAIDILQSVNINANNQPITTSFSVYTTATATIPTWATKALVISTATFAFFAAAATTVTAIIESATSNPNAVVDTPQTQFIIPAGGMGTLTLSQAVPFTGLIPGTTAMTVKAAALASAGVAADTRNNVNLTTSIQFQKV